MLRHWTDYYLANKGCDTSLIQDYHGYRSNFKNVDRPENQRHSDYALSNNLEIIMFCSRILARFIFKIRILVKRKFGQRCLFRRLIFIRAARRTLRRT